VILSILLMTACHTFWLFYLTDQLTKYKGKESV